jgi:hypothetical protein
MHQMYLVGIHLGEAFALGRRHGLGNDIGALVLRGLVGGHVLVEHLLALERRHRASDGCPRCIVRSGVLCVGIDL